MVERAGRVLTRALTFSEKPQKTAGKRWRRRAARVAHEALGRLSERDGEPGEAVGPGPRAPGPGAPDTGGVPWLRTAPDGGRWRRGAMTEERIVRCLLASAALALAVAGCPPEPLYDNDAGVGGSAATGGTSTGGTGTGGTWCGISADAVAVQATAVGESHTCVLTTSGGVRCWGHNQFGQLGDGTTEDRSAPPGGDVVTGVQAIAAGLYHTCALTTTGGVRCWGANESGQLGDGSTTDRSDPAHDRRAHRRSGHRGGRQSHLRADDDRRGPLLGRQLLRPARRRHDDGPLDAHRPLTCSAASRPSRPAPVTPAR